MIFFVKKKIKALVNADLQRLIVQNITLPLTARG